MPKLTDEELVAACLAGKESAYALLIERHQERLYRVAARICRDPRDAEDTVQEALIQVVRDLPKWRPVAPLEAWLVTITVRTAKKVDERSNRAAKRGESLDRPQPDGSVREYPADTMASNPVASADEGELQGRLRAAIAALPYTYRPTLTLRLNEGLTPKEIGAALGIPERTVRSHLLRGGRLLRVTLGDLAERQNL